MGFYGSKNVVEKVNDDNVLKNLHITYSYGVKIYGKVLLRYCDQVIFSRLLGFNKDGDAVYDNVVMVLHKDVVFNSNSR